MARPRSDGRRSAIISAAIRIIASQGTGVSTAAIAKEAGISNGSLFTYFPTKADLLNALYREIKAEMGEAALDGLPTEYDTRRQMYHMWSQWLHWATSSPHKHRALAHLVVSDEITPESHRAGKESMAGIARLLQRSCEVGPMRGVPIGFVTGLMSSLAETTIDFMIENPTEADTHCSVAFDALWRMIA